MAGVEKVTGTVEGRREEQEIVERVLPVFLRSQAVFEGPWRFEGLGVGVSFVGRMGGRR